MLGLQAFCGKPRLMPLCDGSSQQATRTDTGTDNRRRSPHTAVLTNSAVTASIMRTANPVDSLDVVIIGASGPVDVIAGPGRRPGAAPDRDAFAPHLTQKAPHLFRGYCSTLISTTDPLVDGPTSSA